MISSQMEARLRKLGLVPTILWVALNVSIFVLVSAASRAAPKMSPQGDIQLVTHVFTGISVFLAAISLFARKYLLSDSRLLKALSTPVDLRERATFEGVLNEKRLHELERIPANERPLLNLPGVFFFSMIFPMALHEGIAVLGFVLAMTSGELEKMFPFVFAALALNVLVFPRIRTLAERAVNLLPR